MICVEENKAQKRKIESKTKNNVNEALANVSKSKYMTFSIVYLPVFHNINASSWLCHSINNI